MSSWISKSFSCGMQGTHHLSHHCINEHSLSSLSRVLCHCEVSDSFRSKLNFNDLYDVLIQERGICFKRANCSSVGIKLKVHFLDNSVVAIAFQFLRSSMTMLFLSIITMRSSNPSTSCSIVCCINNRASCSLSLWIPLSKINERLCVSTATSNYRRKFSLGLCTIPQAMFVKCFALEQTQNSL